MRNILPAITVAALLLAGGCSQKNTFTPNTPARDGFRLVGTDNNRMRGGIGSVPSNFGVFTFTNNTRTDLKVFALYSPEGGKTELYFVEPQIQTSAGWNTVTYSGYLDEIKLFPLQPGRTYKLHVDLGPFRGLKGMGRIRLPAIPAKPPIYSEPFNLRIIR